MLHKPNASELIEQVRADPRVRQAFDRYHKFLNEPDDIKKLYGSFAKLSNKAFGVRLDLEASLLSIAILHVAIVYGKLKRKSPQTVRTIGPLGKINRRPFDTFAAEVFVAEGLDPPGPYRIRKAFETPYERAGVADATRDCAKN